MELTIIRTFLNYGDNSKVVYIAPTKSLCSERVKDWENKFKPFGIICKYKYASPFFFLRTKKVLIIIICVGNEFTGDTSFISVASIRKTSIM